MLLSSPCFVKPVRSQKLHCSNSNTLSKRRPSSQKLNALKSLASLEKPMLSCPYWVQKASILSKLHYVKGFKGKPFISFYFFLAVSVKLGRKMGVSHIFWSKKLKPVVVSWKPCVFGGVGGLTPGWVLGPSLRKIFAMNTTIPYVFTRLNTPETQMDLLYLPRPIHVANYFLHPILVIKVYMPKSEYYESIILEFWNRKM